MLEKHLLIEYPIKFLQTETHGIMTGDLILFACGTGGGKSTLSRIITRQAAAQNCPVVLYSLEDEKGTYAASAIYQKFLSKNYSELDFRAWLLSNTQHPEKYQQYAIQCRDEALKTTTEGLPLQVVHEMSSEFMGADVLWKIIASIRQEIDKGYKLFVLDHLDVLVPSERPEEMVRAMTELWRLVNEKQIALITFSQLASGRNKEVIAPGLDDIRGSKSKVHTSTIVVSLARDCVSYYPEHKGSPTICRILKNRLGGKTAIATIFYHKGQYTNDFVHMTCNESGMIVNDMSVHDFYKRQATLRDINRQVEKEYPKQ